MLARHQILSFQKGALSGVTIATAAVHVIMSARSRPFPMDVPPRTKVSIFSQAEIINIKHFPTESVIFIQEFLS